MTSDDARLELEQLIHGFTLAAADLDFDAAEAWLDRIAGAIADREAADAP